MADDSPVFERFLSLAKRELAADDVRLLATDEAVPDAPNALVTRLRDGRHVVASFAEAPRDRDALERRLAMLAATFADALATPPSERTRARPPVATSLHEELKVLAARARAIDVLVIDVDSPVIWGSAGLPSKPRAQTDKLLRDVSARELAVPDDDSRPTQDMRAPAESSPMASMLDDDDERAGAASPSEEPEATRRAIAAVRREAEIAGLHKGRHLRHVARDTDFVLALSFSGIYVLCLVFDGPFDELRAERAAHESLPRIERLVLALPPLDPEPQPMGGVIAFRRRRR
jgi:hypothetical protein